MEPNYSQVRGQNAALDAAMTAYNEARFGDAAMQLDAVAQSPGASDVVRRVALRMLGRTRLATGDRSGAAEALRRLVENEPPRVRLDPDVEPLALLETFYDVRRDADGSVAIQTDRSRVLAIADFENGSITDGPSVDPLRLGFPALMLSEMQPSVDLEMVERVRLEWLLNEQSLSRDQAGVTEAGRLLGASHVVFGTFIKNGDQMTLLGRVVEVATTRILRTDVPLRVEGRADQYGALVSCLSQLVAEAVDARLPVETASSEPGESLDAVIAYARGLAFEESEDYAAAAEQYQLALSLDPSYEAAQMRLSEGVDPFLAANN